MAAGSLGLLANRSIAAAAGPAPQLPARGEYIVRNGYVLTMDPKLGDIPQGDVHVRDGAIVAVGPNLGAPGAEVIDARTMIVQSAHPNNVDTVFVDGRILKRHGQLTAIDVGRVMRRAALSAERAARANQQR
jgi:cytosine/adenosine deaminase-related metal-dependent hydrolase